MTPQELRSSILTLAFEGRLFNDVSFDAEKLYASIQSIKNEKSHNDKMRFKKINPLCDEDKPYDLPSNWKWVRLCDVFYLIPTGVDYYEGKKKYYSTGSIDKSKLDPEGEYDFNDRPSRANREHILGDLIDAKMQNTLKTLVIDEELSKSIFSTGFYGLRMIKGNVKYLKYYIESPFYQTIKNSQCSGTTQKAINDDKLINIPFPLAPLEVQDVVVSKIEELLSLVDRYEKAWNKLEQFNKKFPADMEKSLLLYAVKGKLTSQIESDGDARDIIFKTSEKRNALYKKGIVKKSKQYPEIADDEIPFEIPPTWVWCRVSDVCNQIFAGGDKPSDFTQIKDEKRTIPVVANGITNDGIMGYTRFSTAKKNTITVAGRGTIGFSVFRDYEYCPIVRLIVLEQSDYVDPKYLQFALNALPETGLGTSIPQLTVPMLAPKLIPLPPLEEQKRIVAKLEELLPLCRKLVK